MPNLTPEQEQDITNYITRLNAFGSGESHACPQCGETVISATLYGKMEPDTFSLYVHPCNCRLDMWSAAPEWITSVAVVPSLFDYEDAKDGDE